MGPAAQAEGGQNVRDGRLAEGSREKGQPASGPNCSRSSAGDRYPDGGGPSMRPMPNWNSRNQNSTRFAAGFQHSRPSTPN